MVELLLHLVLERTARLIPRQAHRIDGGLRSRRSFFAAILCGTVCGVLVFFALHTFAARDSSHAAMRALIYCFLVIIVVSGIHFGTKTVTVTDVGIRTRSLIMPGKFVHWAAPFTVSLIEHGHGVLVHQGKTEIWFNWMMGGFEEIRDIVLQAYEDSKSRSSQSPEVNTRADQHNREVRFGSDAQV